MQNAAKRMTQILKSETNLRLKEVCQIFLANYSCFDSNSAFAEAALKTNYAKFNNPLLHLNENKENFNNLNNEMCGSCRPSTSAAAFTGKSNGGGSFVVTQSNN